MVIMIMTMKIDDVVVSTNVCIVGPISMHACSLLMASHGTNVSVKFFLAYTVIAERLSARQLIFHRISKMCICLSVRTLPVTCYCS